MNDKCLSGELPAARSFWGGGVLDSFDVHANLYHVTYTDDDKEEIDSTTCERLIEDLETADSCHARRLLLRRRRGVQD